MKEEIRKAAIEQRLKDIVGEQAENKQILLMGASHRIASHILDKFLEAVPNAHITLQDAKDPNMVFLNPKLRAYQGTSRCTIKQTSPHDWDWLTGDVNQYDVIINCGCVHDAVYCYHNPVDSMFRNAMQGEQLMQALLSGSGWKSEGKLIICSTDKVYGPQPVMPTPETAPINPQGVRATTRAAQELIQTGMAKCYGIKYVALRVGTTYGEYMPTEKCIYRWCRALLLHQPLYMDGEFANNDSPSRDFINYKDVVSLIAFLAMTDWSTEQRNEIYNIGKNDSQPRYLWNIAEGMKTVLRKGTNTLRTPWREPGERNLRVWMDSTKAHNKLFWLPNEETIYGITMYLAPWIAYHDLRWTEEQIIDLKKQLGIRDNVTGGAGPAKGTPPPPNLGPRGAGAV